MKEGVSWGLRRSGGESILGRREGGDTWLCLGLRTPRLPGVEGSECVW